MRAPFLAALLLAPLLAGCIDLGDSFMPGLRERVAPIGEGEDTDLDGIPDVVEVYRQSHCVIANVTCEELGITPPTVGTRDLIVAHFHSGRDLAGYRVRDASWDHLETELADQGITLQVAQLGVRNDIDPEAIWDTTPFPRTTEEDVFWHVWVYPVPQDDFWGW